jgi:hypothetical protein
MPSKQLLNGEKLSPAMQLILVHGFGYDADAIRQTSWIMKDALVPSGALGITLNHHVYYTERASLYGNRQWFGLIVHEMTHREQINRGSAAGFYAKYALQAIKGYENIDYEKEAYFAHSQAIGGEQHGQHAPEPCLWDYSLPEVAGGKPLEDILLDDAMPDATKFHVLKHLCLSWRIAQTEAMVAEDGPMQSVRKTIVAALQSQLNDNSSNLA